MTRKKAFGNKKKKEQLQQKRKEKRERGAQLGDDIPYVDPSGQTYEPAQQVTIVQPANTRRKKGRPSASEKKAHPNRSFPGLKKLPADLRTIFDPEPRPVIEARKKAAEVPIVRGHEEELRKQDTNMYSADVIGLPVRPEWSSSMSVEQIEESESRYFEGWLRDIYQYPRDRLNYFEHNLEVWRQLWRVCEMSDVLVLVADIRHPLFHFPPSLYYYITEYHKKPMILLLNKIDLVTKERVRLWASYFEEKYPHLHVIPFSTHTQMAHVHDEFTQKHKRLQKGKMSARYLGARGGSNLIDAICQLAFPGDPPLTEEEISQFEYHPPEPVADSPVTRSYQASPGHVRSPKAEDQEEPSEEEEEEEEEEEDEENEEEDMPSTQEVESDSKQKGRVYRVIGMVGHPNVGKSSLINGMKRKKVVSTSRTPGHTKHFQTIFLTKHICLCDCPGLVFPALDMKKELQILCGLFPIAQVREPYSSLRYLAERVRVEEIYKLEPPPDEQDEYTRLTYPWSGWNIAQCYAIKRGYRAKGGRENAFRGGQEILKDTLDGVVLLAFDPPNKELPLQQHAVPI